MTFGSFQASPGVPSRTLRAEPNTLDRLAEGLNAWTTVPIP